MFGPLVLLFGLVLAPSSVLAQWRTQTIQLQPGWNAVHLEVQPEPDDCDVVLANLPIESVWKWNRRFSSIQFVQDPSTLLPEDPDWLVWLPQSNQKAFLRRLRALQANQSYLIKVADGAGPVTLAIKGQVVIPDLEWYPHGLNLVGFPVISKSEVHYARILTRGTFCRPEWSGKSSPRVQRNPGIRCTCSGAIGAPELVKKATPGGSLHFRVLTHS